MHTDEIQKIREQRPRMAICYDFDKTLSPDDMQAFTLIPSFGVDKDAFWEESNRLAEANRMDTNLAWMYELTRYSKFLGKSLRREYFQEIGGHVPLYQGVDSWFDRINAYGEKRGVEVEHYIISSGLKEIIEGSSISKYFKRIYASSFLYDADGIAIWPTQAINYTNKTQYIFRIAKGFLEEYDERVNDSIPKKQYHVPYENIVYIGDSATDIPCMRLVKSKGGYAIGVFDPERNNRAKVYQLFKDGRINFYAPADYTAGSDAETYVRQIVNVVAARETMRKEQRIQAIHSDDFWNLQELQKITDMIKEKTSAGDQKALEGLLEKMRCLVEGNVD